MASFFTNYNLYFSKTKVTGPSLTSETSIIAANTPVFTQRFDSFNFVTNCSYMAFAYSGASALSKLGLVPFLQSAASVN